MTRPPATNDAAKEAMNGAVRDAVRWDVVDAVGRDVWQTLLGAVCGAVVRAATAAVAGVVLQNVFGSNHPALQDFLRETEAEA